MAGAQLIRPDRHFVEEIIATGGGDLKRCFQCASCSVVCDLANGGRPFPRKEMIWAQWGLEDRLVADPDIWLCHQCNDCSRHCPRGARPGDVLSAIRRHTVGHFATPAFFSRWVNDARLIPATLLIPVVFIALALLARGPLERSLALHNHPGFYSDFFPHWLLIGSFGGLACLVFAVAVVGMARHWRAMKAADVAAGTHTPVMGLVPAFLAALGSIATHSRFASCEAQASRRVTHLTAFYGFLALFVVTLWAVVDIYVNPLVGSASLYPFGLGHPMKILANVGGALLIFGSVRAILSRRDTGAGASASTSFDLIFLWVMLGVGVTGYVVEAFRFAEPAAGSATASAAYAVYFLHLVLVFQLLMYLPYTKFAHVLYRGVAMIYAEHTGRRRAALVPPAAPEVLEAAPAPEMVGAGEG
jgi:quinone-modifying oxidoreductase subunit QmoC